LNLSFNKTEELLKEKIKKKNEWFRKIVKMVWW
jgi:hypothetical protein